MKLVIRAVALGFAFLGCACLPVTTKSPVGSTVGFTADPALFGLWRGAGKLGDTPGYVTFMKAPDGGMSAVLVSPADRHSNGDWEVYEARAAILGGHRFLSVRGLYSNGHEADDWKEGVTTPVLYRVTGKTLTLYLLDEEATAAAIKSGALKGSVEEDMRNERGEVTIHGDVHITEEAAVLDAFMKSPRGLALFKKALMVLRKVE